MPLVVDHPKRRSEIVELVARIIATRGLEAVTVRSVAEAAGCSTAVVSHYFAGKRDLLLRCYQFAEARSNALLEAAAAAHNGDLAETLDVLLPHHPQARESWLVWVAFWGVAIADPEFSVVQQQQIKESQGRIARLLAASPRQKSGASDSHNRDAATNLLTMLMGIAVQAAFDPADWPRERQRRQLAVAIRNCEVQLT